MVALGIISDLVLSGKRMGKFVSAVFASLTILIIVAPLPNLLGGNIDADNFLLGSGVELDEGYLEYASELKAKAMSKGVIKALDEAGYANVEVTIEGDFGQEIDIKRVTVNLSKMVMSGNVAHINKYEAIETLVSGYLGVDKGVIVINE